MGRNTTERGPACWGTDGCAEFSKAFLNDTELTHNNSVTNQITNLMEECPSWKSNSYLAAQGIHSILWSPKIHYCLHQVPPFLPNLNQVLPIHTLPPYLFKSILILSSHLFPGLHIRVFPICISDVFHALYMLRPSHLPWLFVVTT
jgi:hypothetical protein